MICFNFDYLHTELIVFFVFLPFAQTSSRSSDSLARLYEMDDHPDRRVFLEKLLSFMEEKGTPITQCPTISKNPLDLFRLYLYTKERGGYLEVRNYTIIFTVWKIKTFSATQILREIIFGDFRSLKTDILAISDAPNFDFL